MHVNLFLSPLLRKPECPKIYHLLQIQTHSPVPFPALPISLLHHTHILLFKLLCYLCGQKTMLSSQSLPRVVRGTSQIAVWSWEQGRAVLVPGLPARLGSSSPSGRSSRSHPMHRREGAFGDGVRWKAYFFFSLAYLCYLS